MEVTVREATSSQDVAAAMDVRRRSWPSGYGHIWTPEEIAGALDGSLAMQDDRDVHWQGEPQILVAEDIKTNAIVGMATWRRRADGYVELTYLYVLQEHQRGGIGAALWDGVVAATRGQEAPELHVWVLERNVRAIRFYERRGCFRFNTGKFRIDSHAETELGYCLRLL